MGKKSKDKGYRGEYNLVKRLHELGIQAKRVPLSGGTSFQKHDIVFDNIVAEVKLRKKLPLYEWLGDANILFVKQDYDDYLVVLRLEDFVELYKKAKGHE